MFKSLTKPTPENPFIFTRSRNRVSSELKLEEKNNKRQVSLYGQLQSNQACILVPVCSGVEKCHTAWIFVLVHWEKKLADRINVLTERMLVLSHGCTFYQPQPLYKNEYTCTYGNPRWVTKLWSAEKEVIVCLRKKLEISKIRKKYIYKHQEWNKIWD